MRNYSRNRTRNTKLNAIDAPFSPQQTKRESLGKSRSTRHPDHYAPLARCSPTA
ncbi:hypothetical protein [Phormidesmis priestleyi]